MLQGRRQCVNPIQDRGPMMLSLACDNRKFVASRNGRIELPQIMGEFILQLLEITDSHKKTKYSLDSHLIYDILPRIQVGKQVVLNFRTGQVMKGEIVKQTEDSIEIDTGRGEDYTNYVYIEEIQHIFDSHHNQGKKKDQLISINSSSQGPPDIPSGGSAIQKFGNSLVQGAKSISGYLKISNEKAIVLGKMSIKILIKFILIIIPILVPLTIFLCACYGFLVGIILNRSNREKCVQAIAEFWGGFLEIIFFQNPYETQVVLPSKLIKRKYFRQPNNGDFFHHLEQRKTASLNEISSARSFCMTNDEKSYFGNLYAYIWQRTMNWECLADHVVFPMVYKFGGLFMFIRLFSS